MQKRGTVLAASGKDTTWNLRLLFSDQAAINETAEYCSAKGIDLNIQSIRSLSNSNQGRFGLSEKQRNALQTASKGGYYTVPREITGEELADELNISHQAISERLRRAHDELVTSTLIHGHGPTAASTDETSLE